LDGQEGTDADPSREADLSDPSGGMLSLSGGVPYAVKQMIGRETPAEEQQGSGNGHREQRTRDGFDARAGALQRWSRRGCARAEEMPPFILGPPSVVPIAPAHPASM
jgi:hypothetical protein